HPGARGRVLNIGSDTEISIGQLAERVRELAASRSEIVRIPYAEAWDEGFEDMPRRVPDLTRVRELIGFEPATTLDDIILQVIEHERARQASVDARPAGRTRKGDYAIETAGAGDLAALAAIETAATALFEGWGVEAAVHADVTSLEELREAQQAGQLWIARATDRQTVGFALVEMVGGQPHLEEIDVHPAHGRRGIGTALVQAVLSWARAARHSAVTLTTFREIPWNAPFYERLGFCVIDRTELSPDLEAIVRDEASRGLDPAQRVVMRCAVRAD